MKRIRYAVALALALSMFSVGADKAEDGGEGLVAHYFKDVKNWQGNWPDTQSVPMVDPRDWTFTEYRYSREEPVINHLFINRGWFSVRWVGYLDTSPASQADTGTHEYSFEIFADDGCRLLIDGDIVIDDWRACWEELPRARRRTGPVQLSVGKHRIVVEYFQGQSLKQGDQDPMKLYWSCESRGIPRQIVPSSHLTHTLQNELDYSG